MNRVYKPTDDVLCLNMIAVSKSRSDNDGRARRHIGNQHSKRGQSHYKMGCASAACDLVQSFCCPLLKFPLKDSLAWIEGSAAYQPRERQWICFQCSREVFSPPVCCRVEIGTISRVSAGLRKVGVVRPEDRPHHGMPAAIDLPPAAGIRGQFRGAPDTDAGSGCALRHIMYRRSKARPHNRSAWGLILPSIFKGMFRGASAPNRRPRS